MGCLDAAALAELFHAPTAPPGEDVERHLDACDGCRSMVAAYARACDDEASSGSMAVAPTMPSEPPPASGEDARAGDLLGARYQLERVVGEGGMGIVWAARDLTTDRAVAVKLLRAPTPDLCRRFEREAKVAAAIGHPNVVEVRAVVPLAGGAPALIMDLLDGRSLASELAARGPLPWQEVVSLLLPLVSAVRAAHARGFVHRDIKPANVFLATDGDASRAVVMLLDFGLAKVVAKDDEAAEKLTRTGAVLGTPHYMAPEQLFGEGGTDGRADIWSLGAVAYEALSGKRPLDGKSYAQLVKSATRGFVRPLGELAPSVPAPLSSLIMAILAVERDARPSLATVHAHLDTLAGSGEGLAPPDGS
jgi:eukaryotic-like serine/threonine-protein kinase